METYDAIVLGLGAMGAAATCQLALAGARVVAIDQGQPASTLGSSRGETKITRLAVGEGAEYLPLVRRSHELWRDLEVQTGRELLVECGALIMGVDVSTGHHGVNDFVGSTIELAEATGIDHEVLDARAIAARFPAFQVTEEIGYFEPGAGLLRAPACIAAQLEVAARHGATLRTGERVTGWRADGAGVVVESAQDRYLASRLVVAAGPWLGDLVPEMAPLLSVQRQVAHWFDVHEAHSDYRELPVFIWMHGAAPGAYLYGFPPQDGPLGGLKVAEERFDAPTSPDTVDRAVAPAEAASMYTRHVKGRLRGLGPRTVRSDVCLYTMTPDFGFVIDVHPRFDQVLVLAPCSGHGFKHSAAIGECAARLALGQDPGIDLTAFRLDRFGEDLTAGPRFGSAP